MKKNKLVFKDFFESTASVLGWTLTWALMMFGWMAVGQPLSNASTQGRVHMQVEDLKSLIALDSRNPSAVAVREWNVSGHVQEELGSDSTLLIRISQSEKQKLAQKIAHLEQAQSEKIAQAEAEYANAVANVKSKRKELQLGRLNSGSEKVDGDNSKKIFENLLQEANLAALRDTKIEEAKEHSLVTVTFNTQDSGSRNVESIVAGKATLWNQSSKTVAFNRK